MKRGESVAPDLVEVPAQVGHTVRVDLIDAPSAGGPVEDQAGVLECAQVLGNGWTTHGKPVGQLADRLWAAGEPFEDGSPGRVAEQPEPRIVVTPNDREATTNLYAGPR